MMKTLSATALTAIASLSASAEITTFDTDLEGWATINDVTPSHVAAGGNPGGYMRLDDHASGALFGVRAPGAFLGDLSYANGETLSFDAFLIFGSGATLSGFGEVSINGTSGSAMIDIGGVLGSSWGTYSTPMTAAAWGESETDWANLLDNVTSITVELEYINGDEAVGFDNFTITPEPSALSIFALGLLTLGARRRRPAQGE